MALGGARVALANLNSVALGGAREFKFIAYHDDLGESERGDFIHSNTNPGDIEGCLSQSFDAVGKIIHH